jgi:hypothetical protein
VSDQAYRKRTRHLYALLFESGRAYIGQTVDMRRRNAEHAKAWASPFNMVHLGDCQGTYADAEDHEYAWRYVGGQAGWTILARDRQNNTFVVNPENRMTPDRCRIAARCRWPRQHRRTGWSAPWWLQWLTWQGATLAAVVLMLRQPL